MSDPPKSTPDFSFAGTSTSGNSGLFGEVPANNTSTGGLSGSGAAKPASQSSNIFGSLSTASATPSASYFGGSSTTSTPSLFSNAPTTSAPSQLAFGGGASTGPPSSIFNAGSGSANMFSLGNSGNSGSSSFSTPNKNSNAPNTGTTQTTNLFGGTSNLLPGSGNTPATSGQDGNTTPAATKPSSGYIFGNMSTTPAGPPPTGPVANSSTGTTFNFAKPQDQVANPFSGFTPQSSIQAPSSAATSNPLGSLAQSSGGLFGFGKPSGSATNNSSTQASSSIFTTNPITSSTGIFGNSQPAVSSGTSLFADLNKTKGIADQTSQADATKSASLYPALSGQKALDAPTSQPATSNLFAGTKIGGASTATSLFDNLGGPVASPTAAASSSTPFAAFDASKGKAPATTPETSAASSSGTTSTSAQPAPSFHSNQSSQPAVSSQSAGQSTTAQNKLSTTGDDPPKSNNLGASTTGPRPVAQSRLKNKSMDEIITRWASDLSKYQKEFQKQALKVAEWDRMLVENSDKIQKLYGSTLEAERATSEVERQLTHVENDQAELESWLDHYEALVDEMLSTQVGQGDTLQGPDQERERT